MLAQTDWRAAMVVAGDASLLAQTAAALGKPLHIVDYDASEPAAAHRGGTMTVLHVPTAHRVTGGGLDVRNAAYVVELLDRAAGGCMNGEFAAMVTAPVQKSVINDAGIRFTGHTEYLAEHAKAEHVVMMLVGGGLRVALATSACCSGLV